jgi:UDP-N-acetylglucosamine acyltransferase
MSSVDSLARVAPGAVIGEGAVIGPFCVIGPNVKIGAGCQLLSHVNIDGVTSIGAGTVIHPFASLGTAPQSKGYKGEPTRLEVGENCVIREYVTMNCGTADGNGVTRVGHRGMFMGCSHVAHDSVVGDDVIFANYAALGGHCQVGDFVFMGAYAAAHQFVRIGAQCMIGGRASVRGDVIPFGMVNGDSELEGFNIIGMRRRKFTKDRLHRMRAFYRRLFFGDGLFAARLDALAGEGADEPAIAEIVAFIRGGGDRPLMKPAHDSKDATE